MDANDDPYIKGCENGEPSRSEPLVQLEMYQTFVNSRHKKFFLENGKDYCLKTVSIFHARMSGTQVQRGVYKDYVQSQS